MDNFDIKEISEMIFDYMQENHTGLLTAYNEVNKVLKYRNTYTFEEIKKYLFDNK